MRIHINGLAVSDDGGGGVSSVSLAIQDAVAFREIEETVDTLNSNQPERPRWDALKSPNLFCVFPVLI